MITYGSSFGYVATAMTLRPPHYQQHLYQDNVYQVLFKLVELIVVL